MRILCLSIADFWLAWAVAHESAPADRPLVLMVAGRVKACSREASLAGVQPNLTERVVAVRCPGAHVQEIQEDAPRATWLRLLAALGKLSPLIESPREGLACLSIAGLERHYRSELQLGLAAGRIAQDCLALPRGIGIASGKFAAEAAASWACPGRVVVVPAGVEHHFLQHLPVSLLPLAEEGQRQLRLLGIKTLEQYTALPCDAVQSRFGRLGHEGWRWAHGLDDRPVLRYPQERCLSATVHLDDPVRERAILERAIERLLAPLCNALQQSGLACQEVQLAVELEHGPARSESYVLREPTASLDRLQEIILELLAQLPCAPQGLTLKLARLVRPEAGQLHLFADRQMAVELGSTLATLTARYGDDCFQRARAISPDSLLPERRFAFEPFTGAP